MYQSTEVRVVAAVCYNLFELIISTQFLLKLLSIKTVIAEVATPM